MKMKIMVLDNYDSFTYNLVYYLRELSGNDVKVFRNDQFDVEAAEEFDKILISPGPGIPSESGVTLPLIKRWGSEKSILGICLGCQAIAEAFGGSLYNLPDVYHGVATYMRVTDFSERLFLDVPENFTAGRYHSWVVNENDLPSVLKVTVRDEENRIMALRHSSFDVSGVQFHPESVLTRYGKKMISNWLN